ncbi:condensation domain-containing protein [Billgrantia endophytica]|uniref:Condensation protein n=1 Tax=Billgrantia endophytica TaxID=2033802 RepID=A0A2N7TZJ8_9GAMM|nr:condensation domain-containing protein [Halomonas endophytica]PMR73605.1 condensation protein [Halomonas endophytica]
MEPIRQCDTSGSWLPLTLAQLDFWEEYSLQPDQSISTVAHCIDIEGAVDQAALIESITRTVTEADVLSVRFHLPSDGRQPLQRCAAEWTPNLVLRDLRGEPDPLQAAQRLMRADVEARCDLLQSPLAAQWLLRVSERRHLWYSRGHHIILDGYGMVLLERRCAQLYAHLIGRGEPGKPLKPFAHYLAEEEAYRRSQRFDEDRRFWRDYLDSSHDLSVLHKGEESDVAEERHAELALTETLERRLNAVANDTGIGWPDLLVMLTGLYLLQHQPAGHGSDALAVWLPFMSRWGSVSAYIPSLTVNILPLYVDAPGEESLGSFLNRMTNVLRRQRRHGRYRIEQFAADRGLSKGTRFLFSPLINVLPFDTPVFWGCRVERQVIATGPGDGFDLTYRGRSDGSALSLMLDADPAIVASDEYARHRRELPAFLARALSPGALTTAVAHL